MRDGDPTVTKEWRDSHPVEKLKGVDVATDTIATFIAWCRRIRIKLGCVQYRRSLGRARTPVSYQQRI